MESVSRHIFTYLKCMGFLVGLHCRAVYDNKEPVHQFSRKCANQISLKCFLYYCNYFYV